MAQEVFQQYFDGKGQFADVVAFCQLVKGEIGVILIVDTECFGNLVTACHGVAPVNWLKRAGSSKSASAL